MKLSKEELKQKISDSITDNDDLVISLLEDIEDIIATDNELDKDKPDTNQNDYELQDNQEDKVSDIESEYEARTSDEKQKNEKVIIDIKGKKLEKRGITQFKRNEFL